MASLRSHLFRLLVKHQVRADMNSGTLEQQRERIDATGRRVGLPRGVVEAPVELGGVPGVRLSSSQMSEERVLLYVHGGGYCTGSSDSHRDMVARIGLRAGMHAVLINYRLAPEHPFPAALEDTVAAYRALREQGFAASDIVVCGDSAGGGLVLAALLFLRDAGDALPLAAVCLSPLTDQALTGVSLRTRASAEPMLQEETIRRQSRYYTPDEDLRNPLVSPLYGDLSGLPPMLIQVGRDEILLSDSTRFADRAREAGVHVRLQVWPNMWHLWQFFSLFLPEARAALDEIGAFIRERLDAHSG